MTTASDRPGDRVLLVHSLWRMIQVFTQIGFQALFLFLLTRFMQKEEYGAYGTVSTLVAIGQLVAVFGLRQAVTRQVALAMGAGRSDRIRAVVRRGGVLVLCFSLGTGATLLVLNEPLGRLLPGRAEASTLVFLAAWISAAAGGSLYLQGVLEGLARFRSITVQTIALNLLQALGLTILICVRLDTLSALVLIGTITSIGMLLYLAFTWRVLRSLPVSPPTRPGGLMRDAIPILIGSLGGFCYTYVDVFFINAWLSEHDTASYFLMLQAFDLPLRALGAYVFVLNREVARTLGTRNFAGIRALFWRAERIGLGLGLVAAVTFFLGSYLVEPILPGYADAAVLMRWMAPLYLIKSTAQVAAGAFLVPLGHAWASAGFTIVGGGLNVTLDILLIPRLGSLGAVYATLIGHSLIGLLVLLFVRRTIVPARSTA